MKNAMFLAAGLLVLLTSCRADVSTHLNVEGNGSTEITVGFTATGTVAEALHDGSAEQQYLSALITARTGKHTELELVGGEINWESELSFSQLKASSDLTGIANAAIHLCGSKEAWNGDCDGDRVTAVIELARPDGLLEAFINAGSSRFDGQDVATTYAANTFLTLTVQFPHDAGIVTTGGLDTDHFRISTKGDTVSITGPTSHWKDTVVIFSGDESPPFNIGAFLQKGMFVLVGLLAVTFAVGRWAYIGPMKPKTSV